ncbi:MAG: BBE domain-containing protein [Pyrinomonadaceae bacterium]
MSINPSPFSLLLFFHVHGAAARIALSETAFTARQNQWDIDIVSQWGDVTEDEKNIGWARTFWQKIEPFTRGVYMNHLDADDGASRVRAAYGRNYGRLVSLKSKYDPGNLFRMNSNITPSE